MNENERLDQIKDKLNRTLRQMAGLKEKAKILETQCDDARQREKNSNELVTELLERQRELNVILNRANIMLSRTQEAMALTSIEFNEMAKALPEPKKAEFSDRLSKINDLFKKTGIPDAQLIGSDEPSDDLKKESDEAFGGREFVWERTQQRTPPRVEAEPVDHEDARHPEPAADPDEPEIKVRISEITGQDEDGVFRELVPETEKRAVALDVSTSPHKKSWWPKISVGRKSGTE
ncbi:MAG: hypothetical protein ABFD54_16280 [Armatimonadota bacterium]|nr:hypothetical protein [bacterium]